MKIELWKPTTPPPNSPPLPSRRGWTSSAPSSLPARRAAAGALAEQLGVAPPVLSFHLKELRFAELVDSETWGRYVIYRARFDTMNALLAFLTENCCARTTQDASCCVPDLARPARDPKTPEG